MRSGREEERTAITPLAPLIGFKVMASRSFCFDTLNKCFKRALSSWKQSFRDEANKLTSESMVMRPLSTEKKYCTTANVLWQFSPLGFTFPVWKL